LYSSRGTISLKLYLCACSISGAGQCKRQEI